jgi:hypothetical protein
MDQVTEAVVILTRPQGKGLPSPENTTSITNAVISRVETETGLKVEKINVFENLHSFSLRAPLSLIEALANAPEVSKVLPSAKINNEAFDRS